MFPRKAEIKILEWYDNTPPDVTQILFITGKEEVCFVESGGRVRIFDLIRNSFLPSIGEFPPHCEVRCSPDSACLIAFVKQNDQKDAVMELKHATSLTEENVGGDWIAHVYFLSNFKVASKIEPLYLKGSIRKVKLSILARHQIHLLYITSSNEHWSSMILKITSEKNVSGNIWYRI